MELNPYVKVVAENHNFDGDLEFLKEYHCVVMTQQPQSVLVWNNNNFLLGNFKF